MVRIARYGVLSTLLCSLVVQGYILDFTCDCYDWVEEAIESAFGMAENAYNMLEAAKNDNSNSDPKTAAVKALSKVMFGKEDAAWAQKGDVGFSPYDVYLSIKGMDSRKKVTYETVQAQPSVQVITGTDGAKRPEKGWIQSTTHWEFVFYCNLMNWTPATGSDAGKLYDWSLDTVLSADSSDQLNSAIKGCLTITPNPKEFTTAAFVFSRGHETDVTIPKHVSQIVLCPWHLKQSQKTGRTSVKELTKMFDQFKGDSQGIKGEFMKMFYSETPEIEKYTPEDFNILHELTHLPNYGKAIDAGTPKDKNRCYGWRNCAKLSNEASAIINADSLAYFALALWFVSQDVCVTETGNLVPGDQALQACGAAQPAINVATKDQDSKWITDTQGDLWQEMTVKASSASSNGDAKFIPSYEFSTRP